MLINGNALEIPLAAESVHCCITSPPYWGLRDYDLGEEGIGLEETLEEHIENIVQVFREVKRVLRDDGVLWLNYGSSYGAVEQSSNKRYNLRDDLSDREIDYVLMEMFEVRFGGEEKAGEGSVRVVLSKEIQENEGSARPGLSQKREQKVLRTEQREGISQNKVAEAKTSGEGGGEPGRNMRMLRRDNIRISDDRPRKQRRGRAQKEDNGSPQTLKREDFEGHKESGIPEKQVPNTLLQLQLRKRFLGVLSSSDVKADLIPTHLLQYFRSIDHKQKDLVNLPFFVAEALRRDGWYLRSDIIWAKPNPMPESVTDRPTKSHEYVFLLSKRPRYFYDADAVREKAPNNKNTHYRSGKYTGGNKDNRNGEAGGKFSGEAIKSRNRRTVWTIPTSPYSGAHFATFPPKLIEPMIKAGTSEKGVCPECGNPWKRVTDRPPIPFKDTRTPGEHTATGDGKLSGPKMQEWLDANPKKTIGFRPTCNHDHDPIPATVFDPFIGSGTTIQVARSLGRKGIGVDLSAEYLQLARKRLELDRVDDWTTGSGIKDEQAYDTLPLFGGA